MGRLMGCSAPFSLANLPALATTGGKNIIIIYNYLEGTCHTCHHFLRSKIKDEKKAFTKVVARVATPPLIQGVLRKSKIPPSSPQEL